MIELRFGGVDVFGCLVILPENPAPEAQHIAREAVNGENHPPVETVIKLIVPLNRQARPDKNLPFKILFQRSTGESILILPAVPQLELPDDLFPVPPFFQVRHPYSLALRMVKKNI